MHPCCRWWSKAIECQHSQLPTDPSAARVFYLSSPPVIQSSARQKLFDTHLLQGGERQRSIAMTHTARRSNLVVEMIFPFFLSTFYLFCPLPERKKKPMITARITLWLYIQWNDYCRVERPSQSPAEMALFFFSSSPFFFSVQFFFLLLVSWNIHIKKSGACPSSLSLSTVPNTQTSSPDPFTSGRGCIQFECIFRFYCLSLSLSLFLFYLVCGRCVLCVYLSCQSVTCTSCPDFFFPLSFLFFPPPFSLFYFTFLTQLHSFLYAQQFLPKFKLEMLI